MATVRMSHSLKASIRAKLMGLESFIPPEYPEEADDIVKRAVMRLPLIQACKKVATEFPAQVAAEIVSPATAITIGKVRDCTFYRTLKVPDGTFLPKGRMASFNLEGESCLSESEYERFKSLEMSWREECKNVNTKEAEFYNTVNAILECAPTLNGVIKKHPFIAYHVDAATLEKLKEKVVRKKEPKVEEPLSDQARLLRHKMAAKTLFNPERGKATSE